MKFDKVAGSNSGVEKKFKTHKYEDYKGVDLGTVTEPSWLSCVFIEWMKMPQV